ncbi:TonB-dependent siderophore receptor [Hyphomicrobium denitrificans ATCC 51888]|uniref:TonB-dependent siderophore receptor n=1 Tax=Hyphomicrobium denitrificans (strain ATCC 51888 / DSM 1869 / NCIMB 11706 / TK 0415) TaxID=582899 RepID=D8JX07_HYPDA|nr:TonB-dependent siderophore receptor [Hyphomicrobium denitrificans ATCC 51888]
MLEGKLTRSVIASEVGTRRSVRAGHVWTLAFFFITTTAAGLYPAAAQEPATPAPPAPAQSSPVPPEQAPPAATEDATSPGAAELPEVVVTTAPKVKTASKAKKTTKRAGTAQARAPQPAPPPVEITEQVGSAAGTATETATGPVDGIVATRTATGIKTDTPLLEVPRTVNVVTKDQIEQQNAQTIGQALRYTPGIMLEKYTASGLFDVFVVRGFEAPTYLDGLILPNEQTLTFAKPFVDPYMLERIEVLKGPASALYGQAPPGGLIDMVSKRPTEEAQNEVFFTFGNHDWVQGGFDFSGPVDKDGKLSYRLVGMGNTTDLQMDFTDRQRFFIAPSLTYRPDTSTTLTLLGSFATTNGYGPQQYVPLELTKKYAPLGRIPYSRYLGDPDNDHSRLDEYWFGYAFEHRFDSALTFRQNVRFSSVDAEVTSIRTEGLARDLTGEIIDYRTVNRTNNYVAGYTNDIVVDNQLEARFFTGALAHKALVGLDYQYGQGASDYRFGAAPPIDAYNPNYDLPLPPVSALLRYLNSRNQHDQLGVYAQDQIKFDGWNFTFGGRHDWAHTETNGTQFNFNTFAYDPVDVSIDDQAWTGFAGLSYVFANGFAPYVSYSTSFQPASGLTLKDGNGNVLKPTTGEGVEAGVKYQPLGTQTMLSAAVFDLKQQNVATPNASNPPITIQAGEVEVAGVELEARSKVTENLDIIAAYSHYFKAEITDDANPANIGNVFPSVARDNASLWAKYTWHEGWIAGFGLGGGVRYTGSQYADSRNVWKVPGYTLFDLAASYDLGYLSPKYEGASLQLNVANLFNTYYVATCVTSDAYCGLGAERTILATLRYKW